jgi:hypothetical protein
MKNTLIVLCILLLSYQSYSQTLKIAHKSHSGNMKHFIVSKTTHTLGLGPADIKRMENLKKKEDSIRKAEEKKKQDSLKKLEKKKSKKQNKNSQKDSKIEKSSLNYQETQKSSNPTVSLAYPVVHQNTNEGSSKSWIIMFMSILPTFLVLYFILQKIRWI